MTEGRDVEAEMAREYGFMMDTSSIKFGPGVTREIGYDMVGLGARRVMVLTDPKLSASEPVDITLKALKVQGVDAELYDDVRVEPSDASFQDAILAATQGRFDGFVAVGGGSTMDTAKAANLYSSYPNDFLAYVNPPIGRGEPVPGPVKPLIAVPTTAGTGSETTGVAIFDLLAMRAKTGIAHRALRPTLGVVDPDNTKTLPPMVAACSGLDVLSHAIESLTAIPYHQRPAPETPARRPAYQGSNPISDVWAAKAIELAANYLLPAINEPDNAEARSKMLLAAAFAGIGFGNAGVHLPHGMSYPVSSMVRDFRPAGYPPEKPIIPHGMSVILHAPAVFRFTAPANPARHLYAARLMGAEVKGARDEDAGEVLAGQIIKLMRAIGIPNGLKAVGFTEADVDALVEGTMPQHRVTRLSPRPAGRDDLRRLFSDSMTLW